MESLVGRGGEVMFVALYRLAVHTQRYKMQVGSNLLTFFRSRLFLCFRFRVSLIAAIAVIAALSYILSNFVFWVRRKNVHCGTQMHDDDRSVQSTLVSLDRKAFAPQVLTQTTT
jgi:hypothetical protein